MITPKYKLEYMNLMNKAGRLANFLQGQQNVILHYGFPGQTYLEALYNELRQVTDMNEEDVTVFEMVKMAVKSETA